MVHFASLSLLLAGALNLANAAAVPSSDASAIVPRAIVTVPNWNYDPNAKDDFPLIKCNDLWYRGGDIRWQLAHDNQVLYAVKLIGINGAAHTWSFTFQKNYEPLVSVSFVENKVGAQTSYHFLGAAYGPIGSQKNCL